MNISQICFADFSKRAALIKHFLNTQTVFKSHMFIFWCVFIGGPWDKTRI